MRVLAGVLGALLLVSGCSSSKDAVASGTEFVFVSPGGKTDITYDGADRKQLPEVSGPSLMDDTRISLSSYRGKVVVLNIWGQWCGPCRAEAPQLQQVQDRYPDQVQVVGIDVRDNQRDAAQDFMRDRGLTYPSIYDPPGKSLIVLKGYPRAVVPATFVLDKQGRVAAAFMRDLLAEDLTPLVDRLIAESATN
ncbi:TlpA family protein disulfide reductase [Actinokineospora globicatena]|uniref:TlpA family protein disulfide reductase n=1 Tax=Actinokineospora globicatena TaxID=103729 RepID=UPI0020A24BCE|nr:TlpA disulfide reductase family protein [Actinokineospora globicatena]MCP2301697.1 Thiol-disulfide isomerase or thioredoxin [Actinokineospora globicatena]GLW76647.1 cytochrome c biogenesis protein [Actinokineospora globicatena]GLW83481.1 cytochrome c biogenesis protein [Actinokineospora globicatena]